MEILLVEDEEVLLNTMRDYLEGQEYNVTAADTLQQARNKSIHKTYDCVILDIGLPDGSGFELLTILKEKNAKVSIIIVSAKDSLEDKLTGFNLGSDDYITKPFHLPELNARIKSLIRRKNEKESPFLHYGQISIQTITRSTTIGNKAITLTQKEYELLMYLISNPDRFLDKSAIARHLWGNHLDTASSNDFVYTHIKKLRKKLADAGIPGYLQTRYGIGYFFSKKEV